MNIESLVKHLKHAPFKKNLLCKNERSYTAGKYTFCNRKVMSISKGDETIYLDDLEVFSRRKADAGTERSIKANNIKEAMVKKSFVGNHFL